MLRLNSSKVLNSSSALLPVTLECVMMWPRLPLLQLIVNVTEVNPKMTTIQRAVVILATLIMEIHLVSAIFFGGEGGGRRRARWGL